jgi:hypothetical protein
MSRFASFFHSHCCAECCLLDCGNRFSWVAAADVGLYFLTGGMRAPANKAAIVSKIPYMTFDLAQVRNGICTIGIQSQPKIEVFVNRKAAAESNTVSFPASFVS